MNARLADRNLRQRINYARFAAAPERRLAKSARAGCIFPARSGTTPMQAGREFVFFVRHERRMARGLHTLLHATNGTVSIVTDH